MYTTNFVRQAGKAGAGRLRFPLSGISTGEVKKRRSFYPCSRFTSRFLVCRRFIYNVSFGLGWTGLLWTCVATRDDDDLTCCMNIPYSMDVLGLGGDMKDERCA
jgi:hypothetical protein